MDIEIYYFTGTGNSLHIAKELQKRIPETKILPIISLLDKNVIETTAETVGFIFPIYLTTLPIPVKRFLEKLKLNSTKYIFTVATRKGTFYTADIHIEQILQKKGKSLDSFFILNMANNSPCGLVPKSFPGFQKMIANWLIEISAEQVRQLESAVQQQLDLIEDIILTQAKYKSERSALQTLFKRFIALLMAPAAKSSEKTIIPFYSDSTCTGCGACERICPSGRIKILDRQPVWQKDILCYFCYACFNSCPEQAILLKDKYDFKNGRYLNRGVTTEEIAGQKLTNL